MVRSASRASTPAGGVLRQEFDLSPQAPPPVAPPETEEPLSFWEQIYDVSEDQWASEDEKGYKVYLYEGPGGNGAPYIKRLTHPFDIEWVKENFGGGYYRATLNNPGGKIVASVRFAIEGESKRKPVQSVQNAPVAAQQPDNFSSLIQMMREEQAETRRLFREIVERQSNGGTPVAAAIDPTTMFRSMVEMFKEMLPQNREPQMNILDQLKTLKELSGPDMFTVLERCKTAGLIGGAGGDLMSQLNSVLEVAEKIGAGKGSGKSLGEAVIEKLPEILEAGGKAMDKYHTIEQTRLATARTIHAVQQRGVAIATPPPQPVAGQIQQPAPQQQTPMQTSGTGLEVETPSAAAAIADAERQDAFIKGKIVEMIANGDTGAEIIDFLDKIDKTICDRFAGASVEQIVYFFSTDPILKKAAGLPRFKAAITELVEELNAPDEEVEAAQKVN